MNFRAWLENKQFTGIKPDDITWWANYAKSKNFRSEQEAREWVFDRRQFSDSQSYVQAMGWQDGPEFNRAFANAIPIYQSGKSFKIGKRVRQDHRLRLSHLEVRHPGLEYVNQVAQANGIGDYEIHKIKWIPVRHTVADENDYYMKGQLPYLQELAWKIKTNGWIEAVIYDWNDKHIIEGQHRARAMRLLGFNTVPGVGIEYLEDNE